MIYIKFIEQRTQW